MAKKPKQDLKAFEEYLRRLVETSPYQPFTTEEIELILQSYGTPKDLKKYRNEKLVSLMAEVHAQQLAQAEANFRNPAQMHKLGELLDSTLIITNMFISQLAQALDMTAEEIEDYIENRLPAKMMSEAQLVKLAELTGIAIEEIRRIANETLKRAETYTTTKSASAKPRPYPTAVDYSAVGMIRDEKTENER